MNATEQAALLDGARLYDDLLGKVDQRTLDILAHRRKTAIIRHRGWLVRRALLLADVLGLSLAFLLADTLFPDRYVTVDGLGQVAELALFGLTLPIWIVVAKLYGLYDHDEERTDHSTVDDFLGVFHLVTVGAWIGFVATMLAGIERPPLYKTIFFWAVAIGCVTTARATARAVCRRRIAYLQNTIIVGAGDVGQMIARKFAQHPEYGINLVGFVDAEPKERKEGLEHYRLLGKPDRLPALVRLFDIERVVIAFSRDSHEDTLSMIRSLNDLDVQVDIVPRLFELLAPGVPMHTVEGVPLLGLPPIRLSRSSRFLKRAMDFVLSSSALLVLSPLFALISIAIKRETPGPAFFRQERIGCDDKVFRIYKFRTMVADADARKQEVAHLNMHAHNGGDRRMFKIPDDPRMTRFGRFLRRYSFDELPQLINVLKGEMSLVGPRPLILDEDQHVADWARKRLFLKPGMTGLWQVLGRSDIPFDEMTKLDYLYVVNWSLGRDLALIGRTLPALLRSRRAY